MQLGMEPVGKIAGCCLVSPLEYAEKDSAFDPPPCKSTRVLFGRDPLVVRLEVPVQFPLLHSPEICTSSQLFPLEGAELTVCCVRLLALLLGFCWRHLLLEK